MRLDILDRNKQTSYFKPFSIVWKAITLLVIHHKVAGFLLNEISTNECSTFHDKLHRNNSKYSEWSLSNSVLKDIDSLHSKKCSILLSFIESIEKGERNCSLNLPSKEQTCTTLNKYSHVNFIGYSHLRHNSIALLLLLTSDIVGGGMINLTNQSMKDGFYKNCKCDKQFDEDPKCRFEKTERYFTDISETRARKFCPSLSNSLPFTFQYRQYSQFNNNTLSCNTVSDKRPQFVFFRDFSFTTKEKVLKNFHQSLNTLMRNIIYLEHSCPSITKFNVVVGTEARQAKRLDNRYTWQSEDFTQFIDKELRLYIIKYYPRIFILDTHMLTYFQPSYDGSHLLTKTNLELTNCVLQTMELILDPLLGGGLSAPKAKSYEPYS